jgi:hypothetical protein
VTSISSRKQPRDLGCEHPGSVIWYLSFGDLLTLLLCFFLVLTPWDKLKGTVNDQSVRGLEPAQGQPPHNGTTLASHPPLRGSVVLQELPILKRHVERGPESPEALFPGLSEGDLSKLLGSGGKVAILVCDARVDRAEILREFSQLIHRVGGDTAVFGIEISTSCESAEVLSPMTEEIVGRVRVTGT